jgi:hypothetical protein
MEAPAQAAMMSGYNPATLALQQCKKVQVQEKARTLEVLTALLGAEIEMANKYKVLDENDQELLFAIEQTGCCTRQCQQCCGDCAAWEVDIYYTQNGRNEKAFRLERPWTLTCCCFNRPETTVTDYYSGQVVGKLRDPFACCDLTFSVLSPKGDNVLFAKGGCCQWGLCCPLPCGPCSEVEFPISDARIGGSVGHIQKKVPSCCKFLFASDVDNYKIDFGGVENGNWKLLLIALSIFIDFRYFNDNKADNSN